MDGTLSRVDLGSSVRHQLTRKEDGKTKTIYVPARAAEEIADWTGRWREVRELLKELSEFSKGVFPSIIASPSPKPARTASGGSSSAAGRPAGARTTKRPSAR